MFILHIKYILLLLILLEFALIKICCQNLRFVLSIFRHGARAPYTLNKDNNLDLFGNYWEHESQLTSVGIRQHYLNGVKNRMKYFSKMNIQEKDYDASQILFYSTNTDRTIMSVYSQIFGMFPPGTGPNITQTDDSLKSLLIPPIKNFDFTNTISKLNSSSLLKNVNMLPVHIFSKSDNYFDLNNPMNCPSVQSYFDANEKSQEFQNFVLNFKEKYGTSILKIINKTENPEYLDKGWNIYKIFDTFESNYFEKKDLTKFTKEGIDIEEFKNLTDKLMWINDFVYMYGDKENWVARYSFSPIFENLLKEIDNRILLDKTGLEIYNHEHPKMLFYSGHDTNLGALQVFLKYCFRDKIKLTNNYFASSFNFEIYREASSKMKKVLQDEEEFYFLRLYFNDVDYFGGPIKYSEFKSVIQKNIVPRDQINKFCGFDKYQNHDIKLIIMICILAILSLVIIFAIYKLSTKKNMNNNTYSGIHK